MRLKWPVGVRLLWCPYCGVPLIQDSCSKCSSKGINVKVSQPGDVRPVFRGDLDVIKEAILNEFNDCSLIDLLGIEDSFAVVNKVAHYDDMKEVIVGGVVVGRYYFDPLKLTWRWRLSRYSAGVALERGLVKSITVDKVKPLQTIGSSEEPEDTQYVIVDRNGNVSGIAVVRNGRIRVQSIFKTTSRDTEIVRRKSTIYDFIRANDEKVRTLISRGIKHIYVMTSKVRLPLTISYSGGKDSLVALDLAVRAGFEPVVIFNDTGLELPETLRNVTDVANYYGLKLYEANAGSKFWEAAEVFGPPAKDYRWCCKVIKLIPLAKLYKSLFPEGALNIIGQRGFESIDRARSGRVWRNRWISSILNITPIQDWPQIAVWAYILNGKLPYNKLYECGFDRLGCYLCPAANIAEYRIVSRVYSELWRKWEDFLVKWSNRLELPVSWVKYALWRWLNPLASGRRRVEVRVLKSPPLNWVSEYSRRLHLEVLSKHIKMDSASLTLNVVLPADSLLQQYKVLGNVDIRRTPNYLYITSDQYEIKIVGNSIEVMVKDLLAHNSLELLIKVLKIVFRWVNCVRCGACSLWCPANAINLINGKPTVDPLKCRSCGICLEVCPVSEVLIEKVLVPLIIGNPRGRRRGSDFKVVKLGKLSRLKEGGEVPTTYDYDEDIKLLKLWFEES